MNKQTFDFSEALKRLKQGKRVTRELAKNIVEYVFLEDNNFYVKRYTSDNPVCTLFSSNDILATDWKEVL